MHTSNHKGNVAELAFAAEAARLGISVLKPMTEHEPYDLLLLVGERPVRTQCKWGALHKGVIQVRIGRSRCTPRGYVRLTYAADEIDAFAVWCEATREGYLIPADLVADQHALHLRIDPPANGQRASLHWAREFRLSGAVAQLAERAAGSRKVGGSNPPSSTPPIVATPIEVGAHEFRNLFGWYIQRARAGEEFLVTRRGKPFARLTAP